MSKEKIKLGAVAETMLITLWARAVESAKTNPILRDPKASEILRQIDYDFARFKISNQTQTACCVRDLIFDEQTRQFLAAHDDPVFVEIGAGLNTRFLRVDDGKVRWFDLDLPDSISLRRKFFAESERRQFISRSVLDPGWFAQVKAAGSKNVMFAAEGVLMYFTKSEVRELFKILAENFPDAQIIFDSISPLFVRFQRYYDALQTVDAKFQWGIRNIKEIEKWHENIKVLETGGFGNLPKQFYQYFPLHLRLLFTTPLFRDLYHINLIKIVTPSLNKLEKALADQDSDGEEFTAGISKTFGFILEIVKKVLGVSGFQVLPKRWVVERTFRWLMFNRRLVKDYEVKTEHS